MPFLSKTGNDIGTTQDTVYTVPATLTSILLSLSVANTSSSGISVDVDLYDASETVEVSIVEGVSIPTGSSLNIISGQKIIMNENDEIRITSNTSASADAILSVLEDL